MSILIRIPEKIEKAWGREVCDEFCDFLDKVLVKEKEQGLKESELRFEKTLEREISKFRVEVCEKIAGVKSGLEEKIAGVMLISSSFWL